MTDVHLSQLCFLYLFAVFCFYETTLSSDFIDKIPLLPKILKEPILNYNFSNGCILNCVGLQLPYFNSLQLPSLTWWGFRAYLWPTLSPAPAVWCHWCSRHSDRRPVSFAFLSHTVQYFIICFTHNHKAFSLVSVTVTCQKEACCQPHLCNT